MGRHSKDSDSDDDRKYRRSSRKDKKYDRSESDDSGGSGDEYARRERRDRRRRERGAGDAQPYQSERSGPSGGYGYPPGGPGSYQQGGYQQGGYQQGYPPPPPPPQQQYGYHPPPPPPHQQQYSSGAGAEYYSGNFQPPPPPPPPPQQHHQSDRGARKSADYGPYYQPQGGNPPGGYAPPPPSGYTHMTPSEPSYGAHAPPPPPPAQQYGGGGGYQTYQSPPPQHGQQGAYGYTSPPPASQYGAGVGGAGVYGYNPPPPQSPYGGAPPPAQYGASAQYPPPTSNPPPPPPPSQAQPQSGGGGGYYSGQAPSATYGDVPVSEYSKPHKFEPKHHSTAQESTLAQLKPPSSGKKKQSGASSAGAAAAPTPTSPGGVAGLIGGLGGLLKKNKPPSTAQPGKPTDLLGSLQASLHDYARNLFPATTTHNNPYFPSAGSPANPDLSTGNRYDSFAPMRTSIRHHPKWYVDGHDYMWAVSCALESAKHTIWILDWWLSPELHLRRPASKWTFPGDPPGGRYRLDNMLAAAAARGVEVKIVVYKEVEAALTLNSHHTKKALEARHPNIAVMRHPDHVPDATNTVTDIYAQVKDGYKFGDFMRGLYGIKDGKVLFWAHHEKLLLVDAGWGEGQEKGFMGGLDLCWGRWDTNEHPLADVHGEGEGAQIFHGQDFNNARMMDFHDVKTWEQNKLDRYENGRMGWTDVALSMQGPILKDLARHFIERWNFIHDEKYQIRFSGGERYRKLPELSDAHDPPMRKKLHGVKEKMKQKYGGYETGYGGPGPGPGDATAAAPFSAGQQSPYQYHGAVSEDAYGSDEDEALGDRDGVRMQILRSSSKWSHGTRETEHSICNAYIETILAAQHFVYIENQFFITATSPQQKPILNLIGAAIVERVMRAYRQQQPFRIILVIPAVPAFAGDLADDGSLGTRAIMEFQYRSICRDRGFSIFEQLEKQGLPKARIHEYVAFYNLRSYDRVMWTDPATRPKPVEPDAKDAKKSTAAAAAAAQTATGYGPQSLSSSAAAAAASSNGGAQYTPLRRAAPNEIASVAKCAMLGGGDIRSVPWNGPPEKEVEAFVSEELYIHSKLLIADDRRVICGSANLNDRSQLGDHDSEIAVLIEDPTPLPSQMAGQPYIASHFAGTLRRQIFRKHLGLLPAQDLDNTRDENLFPSPVPNVYDFDTDEDHLVADPLGQQFTRFWETVADTNTDVFRKVFRPVPDDSIRNWKQYDEWFSAIFKAPKLDAKATAAPRPGAAPPVVVGEKGAKPVGDPALVETGPAKEPQAEEKWGHVVRRDFDKDPVRAAQQVKTLLARVRGHLVHMPTRFLEEEDIAKEGVGLNALTETIYT